MRHFIAALTALLMIPGGVGSAGGAVMLYFDHGGGAIEVLPGASFQFDALLVIDGPEQVLGFDYYLEGSGIFYDADFRLLDRTSNLAFFPDLNTADAAVVIPEADAILNPWNARSLGALVAENPVSGTGSYLLASFSVAVSPQALPGSYSLTSVLSFWLDENAGEQSFSVPGALAVQVVPEPSPALLVAAVAALALCRRPRAAARRVSLS